MNRFLVLSMVLLFFICTGLSAGELRVSMGVTAGAYDGVTQSADLMYPSKAQVITEQGYIIRGRDSSPLQLGGDLSAQYGDGFWFGGLRSAYAHSSHEISYNDPAQSSDIIGREIIDTDLVMFDLFGGMYLWRAERFDLFFSAGPTLVWLWLRDRNLRDYRNESEEPSWDLVNKQYTGVGGQATLGVSRRIVDQARIVFGARTHAYRIKGKYSFDATGFLGAELKFEGI